MRLAKTTGLVAVLVSAALLTGCTPDVVPAPTRAATVRPDPVRWAAHDAAAPVAVAAPTALARAIAASRALFAAAPGVVVAPDRDGAAHRRAAAAAARLHVPVLLVPAAPAPGPSPSASPSTTPSAGEAAAVTAEVRRLGARWIAGSGTSAPRIAGVRRIALAAARVAAAPPPAPVLVVASRPGADTAALGTARAAGARVVTLPGGSADVNADGAAVTALATAKRDGVVLLGSAFAGRRDLGWAVAAARTGVQYAGGGQRPFSGRLSVALYGAPGEPALGVLGRQGAQPTVERARALAKRYAPLVRTPVQPVLEVIATVAAGSPTDDGDYSSEIDLAALRRYVDAAERAGIPVVLDLQPGRSDFLQQAKRLEPLLARPRVGLALDPEWRLGAGQKPLVQIGRVSAGEVNRTSAWLADLVRRRGLPPKAFVLHQFRLTMLQDRGRIVVDRPQLDTLIHVDGQGGRADKQATWAAVRAGAPPVAWGWKNFLEKDHPVLTPAQTIAQVHPTPDLITYQ